MILLAFLGAVVSSKARSADSVAGTETITAQSARTEGAERTEGKINLRVLYAGHPQTPRMKDFVEFLEKSFVKVGQGDLDAFRERDAEGYDVVILDYGELKIIGNSIYSPKVPFSERYSRATVTIGATGALVSDSLKLKTGYL
jgi:hypothetical protein